ncbi:hypothetical protein BHE74_00006602 [Ensete ventricosum]|nr:hypothetical protein BHE74_00006602 [Ensete ventricosum]
MAHGRRRAGEDDVRDSSSPLVLLSSFPLLILLSFFYFNRPVWVNEKIVALHTDGLQGVALLGDVQLGTAAAVPQTPGCGADANATPLSSDVDADALPLCLLSLLVIDVQTHIDKVDHCVVVIDHHHNNHP